MNYIDVGTTTEAQMSQAAGGYRDERANQIIRACAALMLAQRIAADPCHFQRDKDALDVFVVKWSLAQRKAGRAADDAVAKLGTAVLQLNAAAIDALTEEITPLGAALRGVVRFPTEEHARTRNLMARLRGAAARGDAPPSIEQMLPRLRRLATLAEAVELRGKSDRDRRAVERQVAKVVAHLGSKSVRVVAKGRGGRDAQCEIRGPSQIRMFKAVALATPRRSEDKDGTWKRVEEEFAKAGAWKGPVVKRQSLRDYGLRIERRLKEANLGADWRRTTDGAWTWTGGVELDS
ncbi:MAG: hypothetical protein IT459_21275 [Planctomycetes bacterium]|nr:hypothetical protein [Planctomycetota bacterium]